MPVHALEHGFGERLRLVRLRQGWSQRDLAMRAGVHEATVIRLEASANTPRPSTIRRLARALGVKPLELTTDHA
jgi:transcriptional regulator with XRE-family HTH domain